MVTTNTLPMTSLKMIEFLVDNIYVRFGGQLFRQMVGIPIGTNCAPLLADLFLHSYESEFLINSSRKAKESLLESSIYHTVLGQTPPDKNPLDLNPPDRKPPRQKPSGQTNQSKIFVFHFLKIFMVSQVHTY